MWTFKPAISSHGRESAWATSWETPKLRNRATLSTKPVTTADNEIALVKVRLFFSPRTMEVAETSGSIRMTQARS